MKDLLSSGLRSDRHRKVATRLCFFAVVSVTCDLRRAAQGRRKCLTGSKVKKGQTMTWQKMRNSISEPFRFAFYQGVFHNAVFLNFSCCRFLIWRSVFVSLCRLPLFLSLLLLRLRLSPVVWQFSALHSSCVCVWVCVCLYQKGVAGTSFSRRVCERDFEFFIRNLFEVVCVCVCQRARSFLT